MTGFRFTLLSAILIGLSGLHPSRLLAQSGTTSRHGRSITCASDDGRRHTCRADTRNGVVLVNQRSGSPCVEGQTWGYDNRGIWVDRGCRADFALLGKNASVDNNGRPGQQGQTITCSSDDGGRHYCNANTSGGVRLTNQRSGSPCIQGQTWGYDSRGIWVDRGCRADFTSGYGGWNGDWNGGWNGGSSGTITCSSNDGGRHYCNANTGSGVRLSNQLSGSPCIEGQTWGYDSRGVWVDRGCRATFTMGGGGYGYAGSGQSGTMTCSSNNGGRQYCSADTRRGVRMVRQISGSPCIQGQTWGYDQGGIWVDRGCRATFSTNSR